MSTDMVTPQVIKDKIQTLEEEIKQHEQQIQRKQEHKLHLSYVLSNFHKLFPQAQDNSTPLFPELTYDSDMDSRELIVEIIKREDRRMKWQDIFKIFHPVKPDIAESTFRVMLSNVNKSEKHPVTLTREGDQYWYELVK